MSRLRELFQESAPKSTKPKRGKQKAEPTEETDNGIGFDGARSAANMLGSGHVGTLAWIDARCQLAGMHALDDWWIDAFAKFYESGKMVFGGRIGLRGGKSVSVCRALVNDALFTARKLDPSTVGVVPIMSANRTEATDRFVAIRAILAACGVRDSKGDDSEDAIPNGIGGTFTSSTLPSGGGVIRTRDSQRHAIEFRVYPAAQRSAIGFTAIGGFCDEVDLWHDRDTGANPADRVLELLFQRFTTQPTARCYIVSATYNRTSAHSRIIDAGDTALQHIARLGELGAVRDNIARHTLAGLAADLRIIEKADPQSPDVPAWVTSPLSPIDRCLALSKGNLDAMFAHYGGRPAGGRRGGQGGGLRDLNRRLAAHVRAENARRRDSALGGPSYGLQRFPGLSSSDPRSEDYQGDHESRGGYVPLRYRRVL